MHLSAGKTHNSDYSEDGKIFYKIKTQIFHVPFNFFDSLNIHDLLFLCLTRPEASSKMELKMRNFAAFQTRHGRQSSTTLNSISALTAANFIFFSCFTFVGWCCRFHLSWVFFFSFLQRRTKHVIFRLVCQLPYGGCWLAFVLCTLDAIIDSGGGGGGDGDNDDGGDATFQHNTPTYLDSRLSHTYCSTNSTPLPHKTWMLRTVIPNNNNYNE